jgi:phage shock protein A
MGIFKRISDILSANFNDMVENWEEPEIMLKQAIREMETTIEESNRSVAKAMASEKLVGKELLENQRQAKEWQARAETDVAAGDDNLARKAMARKQENEKVTAARLDSITGSGSGTNFLDSADAPAEGDDTLLIHVRTGSGDIDIHRAVATHSTPG